MVITKISVSCPCGRPGRDREMKYHHSTLSGDSSWQVVFYVCTYCRASQVFVFGNPSKKIMEKI